MSIVAIANEALVSNGELTKEEQTKNEQEDELTAEDLPVELEVFKVIAEHMCNDAAFITMQYTSILTWQGVVMLEVVDHFQDKMFRASKPEPEKPEPAHSLMVQYAPTMGFEGALSMMTPEQREAVVSWGEEVVAWKNQVEEDTKFVKEHVSTRPLGPDGTPGYEIWRASEDLKVANPREALELESKGRALDLLRNTWMDTKLEGTVNGQLKRVNATLSKVVGCGRCGLFEFEFPYHLADAITAAIKENGPYGIMLNLPITLENGQQALLGILAPTWKTRTLEFGFVRACAEVVFYDEAEDETRPRMESFELPQEFTAKTGKFANTSYIKFDVTEQLTFAQVFVMTVQVFKLAEKFMHIEISDVDA